MTYIATNKMSDLMQSQAHLMALISRFGLPFGVEEQTIDEVCQAHNIDTNTFLSIVNYLSNHSSVNAAQMDLNTLQVYLKSAHSYYLRYKLPMLRHLLIESLPSSDDHQVVILILKFYDDFVQLVKRHIQQENAGVVKSHEKDNQHITEKLNELINLIIKFYPTEHSAEYSDLIVNALTNLHQTQKELMAHCAIEDYIYVPALLAQHAQETHDNGEALSDREKDVLVEVVNGYSNKQIADHLCLSIHTVISHRKNIVRKLNIHSTAGLTIYAVMNKLVRLEELKGI